MLGVAVEKMHFATVAGPLAVGLGYVGVNALVREPHRQQFNAIMIAGAGAAYLNGGFGVWEFAFTGAVTFCAFKGLRSYQYIGIGWLLHTGWDVLHHMYGTPIVPFVADSSLGCAICDPVIALWCFAGAPSLIDVLRGRWRSVPAER